MTAPSDLPALYRSRPIILWVEDEETRTYLKAAWQDPDISLLVAGGHENIYAVVKSARKDTFAHVFGFRDRDFGGSNRATWARPETEVMTSESFEVENYALDANAMEACDVNTSGKTAPQLAAELSHLASMLPWWMSCRRAITEIRDNVTNQFIAHPKRGDVTSQAEAEAAIFTKPWWTGVLPAIPTAVTRPQVQTNLQQHQAAYVAMLTNGQWKTHFAGKEILREVVTRVWTKRRTARLHSDFIQAIAEAQRIANQVPAEVTELRAVLRIHVNLPP